MKPIPNDTKCEYRYFRSGDTLIYRIRESDSSPCDLQGERDPNFSATIHLLGDCNACTMDHKRYKAEYKDRNGWFPAAAACFSKSFGYGFISEISEEEALGEGSRRR